MNRNLNRFFKRPTIVAAELFSAGWCNLDCKYCYIPKTEFLKTIHSDIIKHIEDGTYLKNLKEMYGTDLEQISHWGTEPSLTTKYFKSFYKDIHKHFPKLNKVMLSSNFMTSPDNLFEFVTEILPQEIKLTVDLQVSCDGPPYITDKNRIGGSTSKIIDNMLNLTRKLNEVHLNHKVLMHMKPTFSSDDIELCSNYDKCEEYYTFFDEVCKEWFKANSQNKIDIAPGVDPTIVLPGTYTSQDGKNFKKLYDNQMKLKEKKFSYFTPESAYYMRLKDKMRFYKEYFTKQRMFTCSSGDSCMAVGDVDGTIHPCHATFYLDHEEYFKEVKKEKLGWQAAQAFDNGLTKQLRDTLVVDSGDDLKLLRSLYITRSYNDFAKLKISTSLATVLELARVGQISPIYKDLEFSKLISCVVQTTECPIDSILGVGSIFISNNSIFRLFGNGYFESVFHRIIKEIKNDV
jgi:sulfatase maturation enzyme AslB (radical SAM superfamily)